MKKNKLNEINKIFLIFMIGSIIGYIVEMIVALVQKGNKARSNIWTIYANIWSRNCNILPSI